MGKSQILKHVVRKIMHYNNNYALQDFYLYSFYCCKNNIETQKL